MEFAFDDNKICVQLEGALTSNLRIFAPNTVDIADCRILLSRFFGQKFLEFNYICTFCFFPYQQIQIQNLTEVDFTKFFQFSKSLLFSHCAHGMGTYTLNQSILEPISDLPRDEVSDKEGLKQNANHGLPNAYEKVIIL